MAKQPINLGTEPTGSDGDPVRTGFFKANAMFDELYIADGTKTTASAAQDTANSALAAADTALTSTVGAGYIDGFKMRYVGAKALTISSGAAIIPSTGAMLRSNADIAKVGLALTPNTWYHVYAYDNAGTPAIDVVTTAPAAPYNGTARGKTGDASHRYIGSVLTDASSNLIPFTATAAGRVYYALSTTAAPFRVLAVTNAAVSGQTSVAAAVPLTASSLTMRFGTTVGATQSPSFGPGAPFNTTVTSLPGGTVGIFETAVGTDQTMTFVIAAGTGTIVADICGYVYER